MEGNFIEISTYERKSGEIWMSLVKSLSSWDWKHSPALSQKCFVVSVFHIHAPRTNSCVHVCIVCTHMCAHYVCSNMYVVMRSALLHMDFKTQAASLLLTEVEMCRMCQMCFHKASAALAYTAVFKAGTQQIHFFCQDICVFLSFYLVHKIFHVSSSL